MGSEGFEPISLLPALWLRFQDLGTLFTTSGGSTNVAADGDRIGRAEDKSGNARHFTQATGDNRPVWKASILNSHGVMRVGDGATTYLDGPDLSALTAGEVFIVLSRPAEDTNYGLWDMGADTVSTLYPWDGDSNIYDEFGTTARKQVGDPTPTLAAWRLYNVVSVAGEWTAFLDGAQLFTTGTNTVGFSATPGLARNDSTQALGADIAEFILFGRKLSAGEKTQMKFYFASRYALTIA